MMKFWWVNNVFFFLTLQYKDNLRSIENHFFYQNKKDFIFLPFLMPSLSYVFLSFDFSDATNEHDLRQTMLSD